MALLSLLHQVAADDVAVKHHKTLVQRTEAMIDLPGFLVLSNLVIFHNVVMMTKALRQLLAEGHAISAEALAVLSPYLTAHINRLGLYSLQFDQEPELIDYDLPLVAIRHPTPLTVAFP